MATDKRARQRANREAKLAEMQKAQKRQEMLSRVRRISIWVVVGIVLFVLANLVFGGDSQAAATLQLL